MSSVYTITDKITIVVWTCPVQGCGVRYGLDNDYADDLRRKGGGYYCPNGHWLSWSESEADKLRGQLKSARSDAAYWRDRMVDEQKDHQDTKNRERAQKAAKTRLKNRVSKGVCPCCNRHFANVARHMKTQHPEYALADE